MCGIAGIIVARTTGDAPVDAVRRMTDAMVHRGPDDEGIYSAGNVCLAHRRLSIIDLGAGHQPMSLADNSCTVVYNGEIYNFQSIRTELEGLGHRFQTHSDTEVLLSAYRQWGDDCVQHFIGMFAFAIHDRIRERIFFARDRLGIKPFYYCHAESGFVFASEIKSLLASGRVSAAVNEAVIDAYMSVGYVPGEQTLFAGIKKLLPGHCAVLENDRLSIRSYWNLENTGCFSGDFDEALEEMQRLLISSVELRLISDVPVGVFLSGGLDSAAVVATISGDLGRDIDTFSIGFGESPELSELDNAGKIAALYGTRHHELELGHDDFFDSLDQLLIYAEEPLVESAAVALLHLSRFAREHSIVLLSGEGADEMLAGYPLYQLMPMTERLRSLVPGPLARMIAGCAATEKVRKYADWASLPLSEKYQGISNDVTASIKEMMYAPGFLAQHGGMVDAFFQARFATPEQASDLQRMQFTDIQSWLPDDLLLKADKMTMAASIELRVPFLDHRLVEFGYSLPDNFKVRDGERKYLLKKLMEQRLPDDIIYQKKKGFPVPVAQWFREGLYQRTREILLDSRSLQRGYFNRDYIDRVLTRHRNGKEDLSRRILTLLILELWHRKYIDA